MKPTDKSYGGKTYGSSRQVNRGKQELLGMIAALGPGSTRQAAREFIDEIPPFDLNLGEIGNSTGQMRLAAQSAECHVSQHRLVGASANGNIKWNIWKELESDLLHVRVETSLPCLIGSKLRLLVDDKAITGIGKDPDLVFEESRDDSGVLNAIGEIPMARLRRMRGVRDQSKLRMKLTNFQEFEVGPGPVRACALALDNLAILSGGADGVLRLRNVADGIVALELQGHSGPILACAVQNGSNLAVSASMDGSVRIWDLDLGECAHVLHGHEGLVNACAFAELEPLVLTGGVDSTVRLWNAETGDCLSVLSGHSDAVLAVAIDSGGRWAMSGSKDQTVLLWNLETGQSEVLIGHTAAANAVALSADGKHAVSGSDDHTVSVWNVDSRGHQILAGHTGAINAVALSIDGNRLVSASDDQSVRIWDVATGTCQSKLEEIGSPICSCALDTENSLAVAGAENGSLWLWDFHDD